MRVGKTPRGSAGFSLAFVCVYVVVVLDLVPGMVLVWSPSVRFV